MNKSTIITISTEATEETPLIKSISSKRKPGCLFYMLFPVWLYTLTIVLLLLQSKEEYGQQIPQYLIYYYIYPFIMYYCPVYFFALVIPFIILYFIGTSYDSYPLVSNVFSKLLPDRKFTWPYVLSLSSDIISYPMSLYSILGPLFYLYNRYCDDGYKASILENVLGVYYIIAYIFVYQFWFNLTPYYGIINLIKIWKFTILQIKQGRNNSQV